MFHVERIYLSTKLLTVLRLFGVDSRFEFRILNSEVEDSSEPASAIVIPAKAGPLDATPSPTTHN